MSKLNSKVVSLALDVTTLFISKEVIEEGEKTIFTIISLNDVFASVWGESVDDAFSALNPKLKEKILLSDVMEVKEALE